MNRKLLIAGLLLTALASADPLTITISGTGSGSVAGNSYNSAAFTFTFESDTTLITTPSCCATAFTTPAGTPATFWIAGIGSGTLMGDQAVFANPNPNELAAGIWHYNVSDWLSASSQFAAVEHGMQCHVLDLAGGFATVWQDRFRGTVRTAIRKAERSGLEVEVDRSGRLLPEFFSLLDSSLERWAGMQHEPLWMTRWRTIRFAPPAMLAAVAKHFGSGCAVWMARSKGEPVAAIVVLSSGAYAKYWRGAMNKQLAGPTRANDLLHRLAIEEACQNGYGFYDMGMTRPASPLAAFKEKLGAVPRPVHSLRAERLPIEAVRTSSRGLVKKIIGFKDV